MKKLKRNAKEWIFNLLLDLLFKFSNSHKLVKFSRQQNKNKLYYEITISTEVNESMREIEKHTSEYLRNLAKENKAKDFHKNKFSVRNGFKESNL